MDRLLFVAAFAAASLGCVGDDSPVGDAGPDVVDGAAQDATAQDAGSDAPTSAEAGCDAAEPFPNLDNGCTDTGMPYTCITSTGLVCESAANTCQQLVNCTDPTYCTGEPCCLTASQTITLGCPGIITLSQAEDLTVCGTQGVCAANQHAICVTDSQCNPPEKCHLVKANGVSFGVCD
ncbi:MAG TPA: hypothetical protein VGH28_15295 [Polyangiaceae bacterium]